MRKVIHGEIYSPGFSKLNRLVADWSSAYRLFFVDFKKINYVLV